MNDQDIQFIAQIVAATPLQGDELFDIMKTTPGGWVAQAVEKHFNTLQLPIDKRVMLLTLFFGDGAIGKCVDVIHKCKEWADEAKSAEISLNDFCTFICPRLDLEPHLIKFFK